MQGTPAETANALIVSDGSVEAYEAFVALYAQPPLGPQAREWLDRHYKMVAWNNAVIANTATSYRDFLTKYPDSDLTPTAQKLEDRNRNKLNPVAAIQPTNVALAAPTCPCTTPPAAAPRKADVPVKKRADPDAKRAGRSPERRMREIDEEVVVIRRAPPVYYEPPPRPYIGGYGGGGYVNPGGRGRY